MSDRSHLIDNVKEWIHLDNEMKSLRQQMRDFRTRKRGITSTLVDIMKINDIDGIDITDGQLLYSKKKIKKPLTKKHLLASLSNYFENDKNMVKQLSTFIMNSRESNVKEDIRRKINIK